MARVSPSEYQEKHARRLKASVDDIRKGVERITVNPCEQAAAKQDKMIAKLTEAVNNGKWAKNLRKITLDQWKKDMAEKGIPRISGGIDGAKDKVIAFATEVLPHIDTGVEKIKKMPDLTIEDSINRASTFIRHMAKFKRS